MGWMESTAASATGGSAFAPANESSWVPATATSPAPATAAPAANESQGSPLSFLSGLAQSILGGAGAMASDALAAISSMWADEPAANAPDAAAPAPQYGAPTLGGGGGDAGAGGGGGGAADPVEGPADRGPGGGKTKGGRRGGGGKPKGAAPAPAAPGKADPAAPDAAPAAPGAQPGAAPSQRQTLSGAAWRSKADANGWVNSTDLDQLEPSFGASAKTFIDGLRANGASVTVTAGLRHPLRAMLMHYAWGVRDGSDSPEDADAACQAEGIDIEWDHGDPAATTQAAGDLCNAFSLVAQASLTSNHISGEAVDMNISNVPASLTIGGKSYTAGPKGSGTLDEDKVDHIGRELGILWYGSGDHVHWSVNGK